MKSEVLKKIGVLTGIGLALGVSTVSLRYLLSRNKNSTPDNTLNNNFEMKLEVPTKSVGRVVGKKGATINAIRERTNTTIHLQDKNSSALVFVKGKKRDVESAVDEINSILKRGPQSKEIILEENTWPIVVGSGGDNIKYISSESKTDITVKWIKESAMSNQKSSAYVITINGWPEQISHAASLIDEGVAQVGVRQQCKTVGVAGRSFLTNVQAAVSQEVFPANTVDGFVSVFVSAVQSPSHFWVQLYGLKSTELDKLTAEMTDFYLKEVNSTPYKLQSVVPSDIVACHNSGDDCYYRAYVLSVEKFSEGHLSISVLFVDYGDSRVCGMDEIYKLKPEYFSLPFQGIKCSLYNVKPIGGDCWSMDAIEMFENITYLANWKPLMAKLANSPPGNDDISLKISDIVEISLVDTNAPEDVDIAKKLVVAGYAVNSD